MCDSLCALPAASADGVAVFAKNSDRPPDEPQDLEWHPPRRDNGSLRTTYLDIEPHDSATFGVLGSRPRWMWGFEHGVNEAGLAVGNEAVFTTLDPRPFEPALVGMDLVRLALERASTAADGVDVITGLLDRYGQGGAGHDGGKRPYWSSFLLVDPTAAYVVETSGADVAVEAVGDRRAISNRLTIPAFDVEHGLRSPLIEAKVDGRLEASERALDGPVSVETMQAHLRSHAGGDDGWTICMHAGDEATTAGMVVALPVEGPRIAHVAIGQPCRSIFVPLVVGQPLGEVPAWERFRDLDDATLARLRTVEADLAARVGRGSVADAGWNAAAWSAVTEVLDAA